MPKTTRLFAAAVLIALAACKDKEAIARADSLTVVVTEQQTLSSQLAAQKDSLTRVVLDADAFLGQMDSAIKTVRGMPTAKRASSENPIANQLQARKDMMERVDALVKRAKQTAAQLAALEKKQAQTEIALQAKTTEAATKAEQDAQMIADLGTTIQRQTQQIATLQATVDSLGTEVRTLGTRHYQAYYVIGTEKELMAKGLVVKEGGANLLVARPGKTLVPARVLDAAAFTPIDQREVKEIAVPDSTRRYRVISRQSLDAAEVTERKGTEFRGDLKIARPDEFWASSRYLIVVKL
jgi:hypothetical protein